MTKPSLSVVIPAYNEEKAIAATVSKVREHLERSFEDWDITVVDNASSDATVERLGPLLDGRRVRVLVNEANRGKGHSVRRGMLAAPGDLVLHCDADCAPSLSSLPLMLALLEGADVVVGSRLAAGARVHRRQPLRRRIVGRSFVQLCRLLLRIPTRDLFCGFKLWRREAARATFERTALDGWTFDAETLAMARALGYRVRETGIEWTNREGSRLSMARVLIPVTLELIEARRRVREVRHGR